MATVYYNFVFSANGGSGSVPSSMSGSAEGGTAIALPTSPKPSRTNYVFNGWSTSSSASSGGYSYTLPSSGSSSIARTFYAAWKRKTITIGYDANGGNEAAKYQTVNAGESFTLLSFYPTRTGYTFKGWSTDSSATTATYQSGGTATRTADTRFYAVWEKITYTVSFNANGGTGAPPSQTKTYGTNLTLSSTVPTRTNYTFKGWSTSNTATTPTYSAGGTYTANASATLYAVWELAIRTITLSYNAGGGSGAPSSESVSTTDATATFQIPNVNPEYEHHVFGGWTYGETIYRYPSSITISESTELSAVWSLETFLITYNANGGSPNPSSDIKSYGNDINLTAVIPVRTGYDFLGWATSPTAAEAEYASGAPYTTDASVTLYAVWELQTYTITYNANGGNGAPDSQSKTYGIPVQLSSIKPYLSAKKFVGWAESDTATEATYMPLQTYSGNADLNLYAVWADATYDSADLFVDGDSCEVYIKLKDDVFDPTLYQGGSYNPAIGTQWTLSESSTQLTKDGDDYYISLGSWSARVLLFKVDVGETYHITAEFSGDDIATTRGFLSSSYEVMTNYNATGANVNIDLTITPTTGQAYFYILFAPRSTAQTITIANPAANPSVTIVGADVIMI